MSNNYKHLLAKQISIESELLCLLDQCFHEIFKENGCCAMNMLETNLRDFEDGVDKHIHCLGFFKDMIEEFEEDGECEEISEREIAEEALGAK